MYFFSRNCSSSASSGHSASQLKPAVSDEVKTGLTVSYITLYSLLFFVVYTQLWLVLYFRYKRASFQTVFLFLCAVWSCLRTTLFSFYISDTKKANTLPLVWYWLLYCFPVCLQFFTLCLLCLYFSQVMFKAKPQYAANPRKYKSPMRALCIVMSVIFLAMNISCTVIIHRETLPDLVDPNKHAVKLAVIARVLVNDILFVICGLWLAYCIVRISKMTSANILLEAQGRTVCQAVTVGVLIVLLYTSRAIYNFLAVSPLQCASKMSSFGFDWYNVSDQADLVDVYQLTYVLFGVVLFVWELLPTSLMVFFFRVRRPEQSMVVNDTLNNQTHNSRIYFFDNPHRYDSDDETCNLVGSPQTIRDAYQSISANGSSPQRPGTNANSRSQSAHGFHSSFSPRPENGSYYHDPYRSQREKNPSVSPLHIEH